MSRIDFLRNAFQRMLFKNPGRKLYVCRIFEAAGEVFWIQSIIFLWVRREELLHDSLKSSVGLQLKDLAILINPDD